MMTACAVTYQATSGYAVYKWIHGYKFLDNYYLLTNNQYQTSIKLYLRSIICF